MHEKVVDREDYVLAVVSDGTHESQAVGTAEWVVARNDGIAVERYALRVDGIDRDAEVSKNHTSGISPILTED